MGRIKAYYHDELTKLDAQPEQGDYPDEPMNDEEIESYLELLHEEWLMRHQAYAYEDNYNPFSNVPVEKAGGENNVGRVLES